MLLFRVCAALLLRPVAVGRLSQATASVVGSGFWVAPPRLVSLTPSSPSSAFSTVAAAAANQLSSAAMGEAELPSRAKAILDFWLGEGWETADPGDSRAQCRKLWWMGGPEVDAEIVQLFTGDCESLLAGEYDGWHSQPLGALAGIILGDQLFRNAFRGTAKMYAADPRVLGWAQELVASGADKQLKPFQRTWVYMPFMHSEQLADQDKCVELFGQLGSDCEAAGYEEAAEGARGAEKYAGAHRGVVAQWGRFPHRNAILGRESTPEEAAAIAAGTMPKW